MKISIIILSFNNYAETTGICLEMLAADPDFATWEVIVVDNASDLKTHEELVKLKEVYPHVTVIFNASNLGFSAGNNVGIRVTSGDLVVLLNSDAFPSKGMIGRLANSFTTDTNWGLLGPVTNTAGNEQCIYTPSGTMADKIANGLEYANNGSPLVLDAYRMDFFCVAIPRHVINQVGLLDEAFGRGYFEDFDYSLRVKQAGYRLGIVENSFVYHRGSTSFGKVSLETKSLIKRNKRLMYTKHGKNIVMQHIRLANLATLQQYLEKKCAGEAVSDYRIDNRLRHAKSMLPKSWFKRWRYLRAVAKIEKNILNTSKSADRMNMAD